MEDKNRKIKKKKNHSLAAKTLNSTVLGCIVYGILSLIVSLSFYAVSQMRQNILNADALARQARMTATYGADVTGFSEKVMTKYRRLSEEQKLLMGTEAYRDYFADIKTDDGLNYETLIHMFNDITTYNNVFDVCVGMYVPEDKRLVYIIDADNDERDRFYPGEWEDVDQDEIDVMFSDNDEYVLYVIEWSKKYGFLCTVGVPIYDEDDVISSFILVDISSKNILADMGGFTIRIIITTVIAAILLALYQINHIKKDLVDPINKLSDASRDYVKDRQKGIRDTNFFESLSIHTGDEIENLSKNMIHMEKELTVYEDNLKKITAEKQRMETELTVAKRIQAAMLPQDFPAFPDRNDFDIYAMMEPAREVGGDFYDFFLVDEDHLCLIIADVSGKGIPAALFMMASKIIIQSCAALCDSASEILEKTNETICSNNNIEMFVTVWLGILELSSGKLSFANAGHEYPAFTNNDGSFELLKGKHDFVVGGMEGVKYHEYTRQLEPGDKMFIYTDGVPEATDANEKMYGTDRMIEALNRNPDASVKDILLAVREDVRSFVKDAEQFDDLTMLGFEYKGKMTD